MVLTPSLILKILALAAFATAAFSTRLDKITVVAIGLAIWVIATMTP